MQYRAIGSGRGGFTLAEMLVAGSLLALLAVCVSTAWSAFGMPAADLSARGRLVQESSLALAALRSDLGGNLPGAQLGARGSGAWVGRLIPDPAQLWLCFDGGSTPNGLADWSNPDTVIVYSLNNGNLVRTDQATNRTTVMARNLSSLVVKDLGSGRFQIQLTFAYRTANKTLTLVGRDP